jgi:hypothetical protein
MQVSVLYLCCPAWQACFCFTTIRDYPQDTQYVLNVVRGLVKNLESVGSLPHLSHRNVWVTFDSILFFLSWLWSYLSHMNWTVDQWRVSYNVCELWWIVILGRMFCIIFQDLYFWRLSVWICNMYKQFYSP